MDPVDPVIDAELEGAAAAGVPADVPADDEAAVDADDATEADSAAKPKWTHPSIGRWALFAAIAIGVVVVDQLVKAWVVGNLAIGDGFQLIGDLVRIIHWRNSGILFGMLPQSAGAFAIVSLVVVGVIVFYHAKAGRGLVVTIALGLLLGGAIGNLIDRLHYGSVVDFVDMGIGTWRFYTYNVADAAISTAIVLLVAMAVFPAIGDWAPDD
jgi:signal peptidase II